MYRVEPRVAVDAALLVSGFAGRSGRPLGTASTSIFEQDECQRASFAAREASTGQPGVDVMADVDRDQRARPCPVGDSRSRAQQPFSVDAPSSVRRGVPPIPLWTPGFHLGF